jgi:hypothetical protein
MRDDLNMVPSSLRAQIIFVLETAGFRNSEHHLPAYASGGVFSAIGGGAGVNVSVQRWDASEDELGELRGRRRGASGCRAGGAGGGHPDLRADAIMNMDR